LKKSALSQIVLVLAVLGFASCNAGVHINTPPSAVYQRVLASQRRQARGIFRLAHHYGEIDALQGRDQRGRTRPYGDFSEPRNFVVVHSLTNRVDVSIRQRIIDRKHTTGRPTTSMAIPLPPRFCRGARDSFVAPRRVLSSDEPYLRGITATISVPNAQTVVSNATGTQLLSSATTPML